LQASYHTRANGDHTYGSSGSANSSKPADIKQLGWEVRATNAGIGDVIAAQARTMWFNRSARRLFCRLAFAEYEIQRASTLDPFPFSLRTMIVFLES